MKKYVGIDNWVCKVCMRSNPAETKLCPYCGYTKGGRLQSGKKK